MDWDASAEVRGLGKLAWWWEWSNATIDRHVHWGCPYTGVVPAKITPIWKGSVKARAKCRATNGDRSETRTQPQTGPPKYRIYKISEYAWSDGGKNQTSQNVKPFVLYNIFQSYAEVRHHQKNQAQIQQSSKIGKAASCGKGTLCGVVDSETKANILQLRP